MKLHLVQLNFKNLISNFTMTLNHFMKSTLTFKFSSEFNSLYN